MTQFQNFDLNPEILKALESKGYTIPTPIQEKAIPQILNKRDFLGIAQTGTGKTAAFSLPILNNLSASAVEVKPNSIRCLILTPTRELASQIADNIKLYGKNLHLKHAVIFGGVSEGPQIQNLKKGMDIVIATPGRLLDLMGQGHVKFAQLEIFVLDEADRMLDMGFINDVKKIISKLPKERQTLFFSATMPEAISGLAQSILVNPVKVEITPPATTVERIDQKIYFVEKSNKPALLKHLLKKDEVESILVFLKTKHGANRLVEFLDQHAIKAVAIHGNKSQGAREKALASFRAGKTKVLVATDIAARGIDVPGISHVINYDIPIDPESYVHRIGRTARAGKDGIAISFCDPTERAALKAVEKTISYQIPVDSTHVFHGVEGTSVADKPFSKKEHSPRDGRSRDGRPARNSERKPFHKGEKPRSNSAQFGKKPFGERDAEDRAPRDRNFSDRPAFGDRQPRDKNFGERPAFGERKPFGDRNSRDRNFGDKPAFGDRKPRERSFSDRTPFGDRKPREGAFGERNPRERNFGERPAFGDKKPFGDRKPRNGNFGERTAFGERSSRSERSFGDKPAFGDRKPRERSFSDRTPFGDRNPQDSSSGERNYNKKTPFGDRKVGADRRPKSVAGGFKKPFGKPKKW
jgi:ATP-dependent RNA helicase RhlE